MITNNFQSIHFGFALENLSERFPIDFLESAKAVRNPSGVETSRLETNSDDDDDAGEPFRNLTKAG